MTTSRLRLFPLNVVLFPGTTLPLHIFEERYREMIGECLEADRRFGVCLIRSGEEVGAPAEPHLVGTEAEILTVRRLPDGRFNLIAGGRRRFRVVEITQWFPFIAAEVAYLDEGELGDVADLDTLVAQAREDLVGFIQRAMELANPGEPFTSPPLNVPRDANGLSYTAAAVLPLGAVQKQELLEENSPRARLESVIGYLRRAGLEQEALLRLRKAHPDVTPFRHDDDYGPATRN